MLVGILSILAAAGLTLVDQLIKLWATVELLPVGSKPFIPHVLEFYYLLNDGMSFSMLSGAAHAAGDITGVMLAVLAGMLLCSKMPRLERAAWILVVGGGVGNLIDRIRTGVVVDYLNCLFINFPVFNFADVWHLCRRGPAGPQPAAGYAPRTKSKTAKGECAHRWNSVN